MSNHMVRPNGSAIAAFRLKAEMKQTTLARAVGVDERTLRNIERERTDTRPEVIDRIASQLDVPVAAITHRDRIGA